MIYHLFQLLKDYDIPGQGLMRYLSFRAMLASVTAMLISFFAGRRIIRWLQKKQIGETIRDLGLEGQMQKKGTPTMGGVIIILAITVPVLLFCDLTNIYTQLLLLTTLWCGGIGFADDYIKVFKHNKEGMSERGKLILQILLGLIVGHGLLQQRHRRKGEGQCCRGVQRNDLSAAGQFRSGCGQRDYRKFERMEDGEYRQEHQDHYPVRKGP